HRLCQASISTAMPSTVALKSSWPTPSAIAAMRSVPSATTPAPRIPATTPPTSHTVRPGMLRVAAATMPTISAASSTSRKTMIAVASMADFLLLHDHGALGGLLVVLADEGIAAGLEGPDEDRRGRLAGDHLFAIERVALEFLWRRVAVLDDELDLLV